MVRAAEAAEQILGLGGVRRERPWALPAANNGAEQEVTVDNDLDV